MVNKKAQYNPYPNQGIPAAPSPVLILGIIIYVIPFFGPVVHKDIPGWIGTIGVVLMVIGLILTVVNVMRR